MLRNVMIAAGLIFVCAALVTAQDASAPAVQVRDVPTQTVLYTIYKGDYDKIGPEIGKLYALAGQKGLKPAGALSLAYLNNPMVAQPKDRLTEIRIPVDSNAASMVGKLGPITDIKTIPAMKIAAITKKAGADTGKTMYALMGFVAAKGLIPLEGPAEIFAADITSVSVALTGISHITLHIFAQLCR